MTKEKDIAIDLNGLTELDEKKVAKIFESIDDEGIRITPIYIKMQKNFGRDDLLFSMHLRYLVDDHNKDFNAAFRCKNPSGETADVMTWGKSYVKSSLYECLETMAKEYVTNVIRKER